jgi:hypothetical protein
MDVRRFFQYLLLLGLLVVASLGVVGLLGPVLETSAVVAAPSETARSITFAAIGVPLLVGLAWWTRKRLAEDPAEARSFGWTAYLFLATVVSLVTAMVALVGVLGWVVGVQAYSGRTLASLLVWGALWGFHWWVGPRVTPPENLVLQDFAGSLVGLAVAASGLVGLLTASIDTFTGIADDVVVTASGDPLRRGAVLLLTGALVWGVYWLAGLSRRHGPLHLVYVLLAGVGAGLVATLVSLSVAGWTALVWLVGDPRTSSAAEHFSGTSSAVATAAVGLVVWWYHQAVLAQQRTTERTEVERVYDHLMSGLGLGAAAVGLTMVVVALVEALAGRSDLLVGSTVVNTLLAAMTLLVVGTPVWLLHWRRAQRAASASTAEVTSPVRRAYLVILVGLGGVIAVVALLTGVYLVLDDLLRGQAGAATLRETGFAIGMLVTAGAVSAYHGQVFRADRDRLPHRDRHRRTRWVLLAGPADATLGRAVAARTGTAVQIVHRTDLDGQRPWDVEDVVRAVESAGQSDVLVLDEADGPHGIPIQRV